MQICLTVNAMDLETYCKLLPKIELHAHLTGSLSDNTVLRILQAKRLDGATNLPDSAEVVIKRGHNRTIEEFFFSFMGCFAVFRILHCLTDNLTAIRTITKDVIQEFVADNVRYLELRTTPKVILNKMTKEQYIKTVLEVMIEEMKTSNIIVRLLVSIDRARGVDDAWDTLQVTKKFMIQDIYKSLVCGVDVSGNPKVGDLCDYMPVLQEARKCGLKLAVHLAEIPDEKETLAVLKSGLVDRVGHGSYIHHETGGSHEMMQLLKHQNIPIEICFSSNIKSGTVKNVANHHFAHWRKESHPIVICTDDKGVFNTTLSEEFRMCAETFNLSKSDLSSLCLSAVKSTFLSQEEKKQIHQSIQQELQDLHDNATNTASNQIK